MHSEIDRDDACNKRDASRERVRGEDNKRAAQDLLLRLGNRYVQLNIYLKFLLDQTQDVMLGRILAMTGWLGQYSIQLISL